MRLSRAHTRDGRRRGYFALSIAILITAVTSALALSLRSKLAELDAESVWVDDREDHAIARQLERIVHDSVQRVAGQRARIENEPTDMRTALADRLPTLALPTHSEVRTHHGEDPLPQPPSAAFFPETLTGHTRVPSSGSLAPDAIPQGALAGLLRSGYYLPDPSSQRFIFLRSRNGSPESVIEVTASYWSVPLTGLRLLIHNDPPDLGGSRLLAAPDLDYLDPGNPISGWVITQFVEDGEILDAVNAPGAGASLPLYRHRRQVCEDLFYHLFKGSYLPSLRAHVNTASISVEDIAEALESHPGLYTQEQEDTPPGEPVPPPTEPRFKMDVAQFSTHEVIYFHHPAANPVEITLLDTDSRSVQATHPLVIVMDGASGDGAFKLRFEEFLDRPILFVLTSTTVEFTSSTLGSDGIPDGSISGAYLMDENSAFATDGTALQSAEAVYGAVLGHRSLLESGYGGSGDHPLPVREFPAAGYYRELEAYSPRALLVSTRSVLVPVPTPDALVLVP